MKKLFPFLCIFFLCMLSAQYAFAGAWTLPQNSVWVEQYMKANFAKMDFNADRGLDRKNRSAESWGWSMSPKFEIGALDWLTVMGSVEYKEAKYKEYNRRADWGSYSVKSHGISSIDFGAKVRFVETPFVLSGQIKTLFYLKGDDDAPGLSDGNDAIELRALLGKKFDTTIPFYFGAETGYRFKNRSVCHDIPFFAEAGIWPIKWLLLKTEIDGFINHDGTGSLEKEYAIWRIGPVFQFLTGDDVTRTGKTFDVGLQYGLVFWGRNTSADQEMILKISSQF
ncbi:MAG: hypothetical protein ABH869_03870 [Candidatus Omnitrophota bacterium]